MNKAGIITIIDKNNYGNRLQNYALQETIKKLGIDVKTIVNYNSINRKNWKYPLKKIKFYIKKGKNTNFDERRECFENFDKLIDYTNYYVTPFKNIDKYFDFFIVGSDQVWNPNYRMSDVDLLNFVRKKRKISYAASFSVNNLTQKDMDKLTKALRGFDRISVREDRGKEIVDSLGLNKEVWVTLDPTFLLTSEEWKKVIRKPKQYEKQKKGYILSYFLGEKSEETKKFIEKVSKEKKLDVIDILNKSDKFYKTGPSEFLYLEKNASMICTDSFHSSVFAIIFNKPFVIFNRKTSKSNMNSRIDTLLREFELDSQKYNNMSQNYEYDYNKVQNILNKKRTESINFLRDSLLG